MEDFNVKVGGQFGRIGIIKEIQVYEQDGHGEALSDGNTKNEIDYIMTEKLSMVTEVSVIHPTGY